MKEAFRRAMLNVVKHGDTDIFPFPIENHLFFDKPKQVIELLDDLNANLKEALARFPPSNHSALVPISYTGFRWATQLDPLWNVFFLGAVLSIADEIERARIPKIDNVVFSYRYSWDEASGSLWDRDYNWRSFMEHSITLAKDSAVVVTCDISEFYPRLSHHRLENALKQLRVPGDQPYKIITFLSNFSGTKSFGIPIGGPASRILSELLLNQIDRLLLAEGIKFCRFADDYHLFCRDYERAFWALLFLSERLVINEGLQLQKAKTRIMSGREFIATSPLPAEDPQEQDPTETPPELQKQSQDLLRFAIRFDPYSPTASDDYEALKTELRKFDIISLLKSELGKSRIHISLSRKIVSAIRFIDEPLRDEAVLSLILNAELLYPIFSNVLMVIKEMYAELALDTQRAVIEQVRQMIRGRTHVMQAELNLAYAIRLLACAEGPENEELLNRVYREVRSLVVRRDIILVMAKWRAWYWLSNLMADFRTLSPSERRAFVVASFVLSDEGDHWRDHVKLEFAPFERLVREWAAEKVRIRDWSVPI